jgi:hypothetical protein
LLGLAFGGNKTLHNRATEEKFVFENDSHLDHSREELQIRSSGLQLDSAKMIRRPRTAHKLFATYALDAKRRDANSL